MTSLLPLLAFALVPAAPAPLASSSQPALASSTLAPQGKHRYDAALAFDGDLSTSWCEGAKGDGAGASLSLYLGEAEALGSLENVSVDVFAGHMSSAAALENNAAPADLRVELFVAGKPWAAAGVDCPKHMRDFSFACFVDLAGPTEAKGSVAVRITVENVRRGKKYEDTCIAEVAPRLRGAAAVAAAATGHAAEDAASRVSGESTLVRSSSVVDVLVQGDEDIKASRWQRYTLVGGRWQRAHEWSEYPAWHEQAERARIDAGREQ